MVTCWNTLKLLPTIGLRVTKLRNYAKLTLRSGNCGYGYMSNTLSQNIKLWYNTLPLINYIQLDFHTSSNQPNPCTHLFSHSQCALSIVTFTCVVHGIVFFILNNTNMALTSHSLLFSFWFLTSSFKDGTLVF